MKFGTVRVEQFAGARRWDAEYHLASEAVRTQAGWCRLMHTDEELKNLADIVPRDQSLLDALCMGTAKYRDAPSRLPIADVCTYVATRLRDLNEDPREVEAMVEEADKLRTNADLLSKYIGGVTANTAAADPPEGH